jgi:hypothetical protein
LTAVLSRLQRPTGNLYSYKIKFPSEKAALDYAAPAFINKEITGVEGYSGFELARKANP